MFDTFKNYYRLTKPGIVRGNAITATAGFFLAAKSDVDWRLYAAMLVGLALIVASACVFNNYLDRDIDIKMSRTKQRALVSGRISARSALIYASILELMGALVLALFTNLTALAMALLGLFFYVVVYGVAKRRTVHGTVIGSISGAMPPVVGYTAVTGNLNLVALVLFLTLVFWQMPHFYAIAMFRLRDYKAARIPVLPAVKGMRAAKIQIIIYIYAFMAAAAGLHIVAHTADLYLIGILLLCTYWLWKAVQGFNVSDDTSWAREMFGISLIVTSGWTLLILLSALLE